MSGILSVGTRALQANQIALQTTGNNIANVNTAGYTRQSAVMQNVAGQFSGSGYIGKGVDVSTIQRTYSEFLTRQSALAGATSSGATARAEKLKQLETLFQGGTDGLGATVSDMLNAFSDVASAPTDVTARTVALARVSETALRMSSTATSMDDLQQSLTLEIKNKINSINSLATGVASVNEEIARAQGNGQSPNDLLDQRDQLVRELNQYIQTTSIPASDGTVGIFIGGSLALVLGNKASTIALVADEFGVASQKLAINQNGFITTLNESMLGGGEVPGLLRFQSTDMAEARNLLGRYALAVTTRMNEQHGLGLDLDGNAGGNLFKTTDLNAASNIPKTVAPATLNTGTANLTLGIADVSKFAASDYEINFTGVATGNITRKSDGVVTAFGSVPITIDGLTIAVTTGAAAGDRFLIKPFSTAAGNVSAEFSTPRSLAVASPWVGRMGAANTGSLGVANLQTRSNPFPAAATTPVAAVTLKFISANQYIRSDVADFNNYPPSTGLLPQPVPFNYVSGQAIEGTVPATNPLTKWSVTLQGAPTSSDTFTIGTQPTDMRNLNSGNASAMMNLRDAATFDGASLTDGYAGLIAQIGVRSQSASHTANVSGAIASSLERDRTAVSGVNLDEEAAKLLQYQQAYQASAKVIQIAQGIFDTLIQTIGR